MRAILGLPIALLVTGALFVLMWGLVRPGDLVLGEPGEPLRMPEVRTDTPPTPNNPPPRTTELKAPPPIDTRPTTKVNRGPIVDPGPQPLPTDGLGEVSAPVGVIAISTMYPPYPSQCQSRGTEGFAVVRYDVTVEGRVVNASVVDSSHRCFERAALNAIQSWRFQPDLGRDSGYLARGRTQRFSFKLN